MAEAGRTLFLAAWLEEAKLPRLAKIPQKKLRRTKKKPTCGREGCLWVEKRPSSIKKKLEVSPNLKLSG